MEGYLLWYDQCGLYHDIQGEQNIWSSKHRYTGALDAVARDKSTGEFVVIDFKTSKTLVKQYEL